MNEYQERVIEEKAELDARRGRLLKFISSSPHFLSLGKDEQQRLVRQNKIMILYSDVLQERIESFK